MEIVTEDEFQRIVDNCDFSVGWDYRDYCEASDVLGVSVAQLQEARLRHEGERYQAVMLGTMLLLACFGILGIFATAIVGIAFDSGVERLKNAASFFLALILFVELVGVNLCFRWRDNARTRLVKAQNDIRLTQTPT